MKEIKEWLEGHDPYSSGMHACTGYQTTVPTRRAIVVGGEVIVQEMVAEHLAAIEKLVDVPPTTEAVPEELVVEAPAPEAVEPTVEMPAADASAADQAPAK